MNSYYFTYGTDPDFPFCGGYTKIFANNMEEAVEVFRRKHPDRHSNTVNCAFMYTREEFKKAFDKVKIGCQEVLFAEPISKDSFEMDNNIEIGIIFCDIVVKTNQLIMRMAEAPFRFPQSECDFAAKETGCFKFSTDDVEYQYELKGCKKYHEEQKTIGAMLRTMAKIADLDERRAYHDSTLKPFMDSHKELTDSIKGKFPNRIHYK